MITVFINLYLPCMSNIRKDDILVDIFDQLIQHLNDLDIRHVIMGGDFNTDLRLNTPTNQVIHDFKNLFSLIECSTVHMPRQVIYTYKHPSLDNKSWIDWFIVSDSLRDSIVNFDILDDPLNLSDHLPVELELKLVIVDPTLNVRGTETIRT